MTLKRLCRVTWTDGQGQTHSRCYQSKAAAEHRASIVRDGRPKPQTIRIERSAPVVFPS